MTALVRRGTARRLGLRESRKYGLLDVAEQIQATRDYMAKYYRFLSGAEDAPSPRGWSWYDAGGPLTEGALGHVESGRRYLLKRYGLGSMCSTCVAKLDRGEAAICGCTLSGPVVTC